MNEEPGNDRGVSAAMNETETSSGTPSQRAVHRIRRFTAKTEKKKEIAMSAQNLTDGTFAAEVLQSEVPVLVDFWAPWCGPCRMMSRIIDELAAELGDRARVVKLNIDEARATAVRYGITSIPSRGFPPR